MKFPKAFDYWGGATDLARAVGLQPGAIYTWRYNDSVPKRYEAQVRKIVAAMKDTQPSDKTERDKPEPVKDVKLSDIAALVLRYLLARGL